MIDLLTAVLILVLGYFLYSQTRKPRGFPPGPPRLPIIGSLPYVLAKSHPEEPYSILTGLHNLNKKYGSIAGFWIGKERCIVMSDYNTMKEVFRRDKAQGRPPIAPLNEFRDGFEHFNGTENELRPPGVGLTGGREWQDQRKFLLRNLRDFGFGKRGMEDLLMIEVEKLCKYLRKEEGKPIALNGIINISITNALIMIIFGESFEIEDRSFMELFIKLDTAFAKTSGLKPLIAEIFPHYKMLYLPGLWKLSGLNLWKDVFDSLSKFINSYIESHTKTIDSDYNRDLLDTLLNEHKKSNDPESPFYGEKGMANIKGTLMDLIIAGSETTSSSILWSLHFLIANPLCQEKIRREMTDVCVSLEYPTIAVKNRLHYLNAFLHESLRFASLVSHSLPHIAQEDMKIGPYLIPKGTTLISSTSFVHWNPKEFEDPGTFKPERFIDEQGQFQPSEKVIPFGIGKRQCLGQTLAEQEFYLFMGAILKKYEILPDPSTKFPPIGIDRQSHLSNNRSPPVTKMIFNPW